MTGGIEIRVAGPLRPSPDIGGITGPLPQPPGVLGGHAEALDQVRSGWGPIEQHEIPYGHSQCRVVSDPPHHRFDGAQGVAHRLNSLPVELEARWDRLSTHLIIIRSVARSECGRVL